MSSDAKVQIAPDSTGANVRTREVKGMLDDGTVVTVEMQVISIADDHGRFIDLNTASTLDRILDVLEEIRDAQALSGGIL